MKKYWNVPVTWQMYGMVRIAAATLEEAMDIALNDCSIGLPHGDYVEDSWELTDTNTDVVRELYNDGQEDEEEE